jgi:hypothetical protein
MRIVSAAAALLIIVSTSIDAQNTAPLPRAQLLPAAPLRFPGEVDSNSPIVWDRVGGRDTLFVMTSSGRPRTASGQRLDRMGAPEDVAIDPWPGGGIWMEGVITDVDGTWYGYYHNEIPAERCRKSDKVVPRIGAARSRDQGRRWEPLGVVLEARPESVACATANKYFLGGVGDFSVQLDTDSRDLYFFFSQYLRGSSQQGVGVARLAWADRDSPSGKIMVWRGRTWMPASASVTAEGVLRWSYPSAVPVFGVSESWHDSDSIVDAFWGPSVHWNTYLRQYVMLLNRAKDANWTQEGIYMSYAPRLDDPRRWSTPTKIIDGGRWYPQIVGTEVGSGTDKLAGRQPRFFMGGESSYSLQFHR